MRPSSIRPACRRSSSAFAQGPPPCPDGGPLPANACRWRSSGSRHRGSGARSTSRRPPRASSAALAARLEGSATDKAVKVKTMQVAPKLSTEQAKKKAPLVLLMGSWSTYYTPSAHNGFAANISIPARRLDGLCGPTRRAVRLLGCDRRGQLPDRLPPRRGDRGRSLGRGQGPGRWDLRHLDDALQRRRARRSPDRDSLTALVLHHSLSARPGCHGLGIAVDALPQRHEAPGPHQGVRVAGHGPVRDLERPERSDGLVEPAQRQQRRRRL